MSSALLVVNPAARAGLTGEAAAVRALRAAGWRAEVQRTTAAGDARALVRSLVAGHAAVFTLGGDGTAVEAADALSGTDVPLGVLPGGTGNQLCRALGTPLNVTAAVRHLLASRANPYDVGRLGDGRPFLLSAGFGLDAALSVGASGRSKRLLGIGAYALEGVRALGRVRPVPVRAWIDGAPLEASASLAMVVNTPSLSGVGSRLHLAPGGSASDGRLDLLLAHVRTLADVAALVWALRLGDPSRLPSGVWSRRGARISVEPTGPLPGQADGDAMEAPRIDAHAQAGAIRLLGAPAA